MRHPMPYGDLKKQTVQKFSTLEDLDKHNCTIEEREEYEPHIISGTTVFAGVDYGLILKQAEKISEVIVWDGGNNDTPFFKPDLHIVVTDPLRAGHEISYYPGFINLQMADVVVINRKDNGAMEKQLKRIRTNIQVFNPNAQVLEVYSAIKVDLPENETLSDLEVLVIEDGPTLTHGEAPYGAGWIAAKKHWARKIVKAEKYAIGSIKEAYKKYPLLKKEILPALGYSKKQLKELQDSINKSPAQVVIMATPADLTKLIDIYKPVVKIGYELEDKNKNLAKVIKNFLAELI